MMWQHLHGAHDGHLVEQRVHGEPHAPLEEEVGHAHAHAQVARQQLPNAQRHRQLRQRADLHSMACITLI